MLVTITSTIFPIFGIIFLGMVVGRRKILPKESAMCINQYVYWIALPCMMFNYLADSDITQISGNLFAAIFGSIFATYIFCYAIITKFFRKRSPEATMLTYLATFPNIAFMGVAVIKFLLPGDYLAMQTATICAALYIVTMLYTDIKMEMSIHKSKNIGDFLPQLAQAIGRNPMMVASIIGLMLSVLDIKTPTPIMNMMLMMGATAAPCALFAMGLVLDAQLVSSSGFPPGWFKRQLPVHITKLIIFPLFNFFIFKLLGFSGTILAVATIVTAMPVGVAASVIAEKYQVLVEDTATSIFINTSLSIISIPLVIAVMMAIGAI